MLYDKIKKHNVKVIFDFDDVVFDTSQFKKRMFEVFEKRGYRDIASKYTAMRSTKLPFSLKQFIAQVLENETERECDELYEELMRLCGDLVNEEVVSLMRSLGEENCYIVTQGDEVFQRDKIRRSIGEGLIDHIEVVSGSKRESIKTLCEEHGTEKVIFVDDKVEILDDLKGITCQNLTMVLFDKFGVEKLKREISKQVA